MLSTHTHSARRKSARLALAALSAVTAAGALPSPVHAINWTGATNTNWGTTTNWTGGVIPGPSDSVAFIDTGASSLPGDLTSLLNVDRSVGTLSFTNSSGKYHTLDLGTHTLTVTGIMAFNLDKSSTSTTTIRDGTLTVNGDFSNIYVGSAVSTNASGVVNLAGLTAFNATVQSFQVGTATAGSASGTITLAPISNITATLMQVGAVTNASDSNGTLHLGANNTLALGEWDIGKNNAAAAVDIVSGSSLNLGTVVQPTSLQVGVANFGSNNGYSGRLDLTGSTFNANLSQLVVGQKDGGTGLGDPGSETGTFIGGNAGAITLGTPVARANFYVGNTINGGDSIGTADLSHMTSIQGYVTDIYVGRAQTGSSTGVLSLPATTTLDVANSVVVGTGVGGLTSHLNLGNTTSLQAQQMIIGQGFANGTVSIIPGGALTLGSAAQPTSLFIGTTTRADNNAYTGRLDLTGATVNAFVGQFIVAQKDGGSGPGGPGTEVGIVVGGNAGSMTIGTAAAPASWYVGYTINGGDAQGSVDLSQMTSLQANLNDFAIGKALTGMATGTVSLPATNTITAVNIIVGAGVGSGTSSLRLGQSNTILASQLTIGQDASIGSVTLPAGGILTLGSAAQRSNIAIATSSVANSGTFNGILDLSAGTFVARLDNVVIGNKTTPGGSELATLSISSNPANFIDANAVTIGGSQSTGTLNYGGGIFYAGSIAKGSGAATFNWTGGTLSPGSFGTSAINFNLANSGTGTLAPGTAANPVGTTNIFGNYSQGAAASLALDIAGVSPGTGNDLVAISGTAAFAGTLSLNILNSFTPTVGQNLIIATYASRTGTFGFVVPPSMPQNAAFQLDYSSSPTQLFIHIVNPTPQTWTAGTGNFSTAGNWDTATTPTTSSSLTIGSSASSRTVSVLASTTVHRISLAGSSPSVTTTLEVPTGIQLGVANQLVVGNNAILSGGGQIFGNVVLNGGTIASFGTIAGNINGSTGPGTIAPGAVSGSPGHSVLSVNSLNTSSATTLAFMLVSPGPASVNDKISITSPNALTLNGGILQITASTTGAGSLGYYKAIQFAGAVQGAGSSTITLPAVQNNIAYTLESSHDSGFIDIHRGFLGDANDDGTVNFDDFLILSQNFGKTGAWSQANFLNDPAVDFNDFLTLSQHFGQSISSSDATASPEELAQFQSAATVFFASTGVPEPSSLSLLTLAAPILLRRRRSRT